MRMPETMAPTRRPLEALDMAVEVGSVGSVDVDVGSLEEVEGMNDVGSDDVGIELEGTELDGIEDGIKEDNGGVADETVAEEKLRIAAVEETVGVANPGTMAGAYVVPPNVKSSPRGFCISSVFSP